MHSRDTNSALKLRSKTHDLISQLVYNLCVVGDVKLYVQYIPFDNSLYLLCPVSIFKSVESIFVSSEGRTYVSYHNGSTVSTK